MTTQEFVKQEVDKISKESTLHGSKLFSDGLTKGLEIAKEFAEWLGHNHVPAEGGWYDVVTSDTSVKTTDELLTIFLTEKYGQ